MHLVAIVLLLIYENNFYLQTAKSGAYIIYYVRPLQKVVL